MCCNKCMYGTSPNLQARVQALNRDMWPFLSQLSEVQKVNGQHKNNEENE